MDITNTSQLQNTTHSEVRTSDAAELALHNEPVDQGVTTLTAPGPSTFPTSYQKLQYRQDLQHDIHSYMSRPVVRSTGSFVNGSTAVITYVDLQPSFYRPLLVNIPGALGFRATACFRLEISASPQVSGIIKLAHFPCAYSSNPKTQVRPTMAQVPNVELNFAEASSVELRVPFISDVDFFTYSTGPYDLTTCGVVVFSPYLPVSWDSTTTSSPSYVLYNWLEDVEPVAKAATVSTVAPQAVEDKPVSRWFSAAASVATFASSIPLISSYAAPLGWMLGTASKVAAHFGWSKPNEGNLTAVMNTSMTRGINTCLGKDYAQAMSLFCNNSVKPVNMANTDLDEMTLCYLTCKPSAIATFNISTSNTPGTLKWSCNVSPNTFYFQSSGTGFTQSKVTSNLVPSSSTPNSYYPSTISFCASSFCRWRGDLVFRFKFATTKFHSGKLLIGYNPVPDNTTGTAITGRYDLHSTVVDLRSVTEVDLQVPFTYPLSWCDTAFGTSEFNTSTGSVSVFGISGNTGYVFLSVLDTLYAPDNVPQTVPVMVEVFSKCGLEFSVPRTSPYVVTSATAIAQSAADDLEAASTCAGERVLSIKQLIMRPYWNLYSYLSGVKEIVDIASITYSFNSTVATAGTYKYYVQEKSLISHFASCFGLVRGSIIYRTLPSSTTGGPARSFISSLSLCTADNYNTQYAPISYEYNMQNSVHIPYYGANSRILTGWYISPTANAYKVLIANVGGTDTECLRGVAAGDDFQFAAFSGVPSCSYYTDPIGSNYFNISTFSPS